MKLKFVVAAATLALGATTGQAATLYDNGSPVNAQGLSVLTSPATTLGAGANASNTVADNFSVTGAGWNVSSIDFYGYQTQTGTGVFTFTSATWSVISGVNPNAGTVVASGTTAVTNGGLVGYRVSTDPANQNRAIFRVSADVTDFNLAAGDYFLTWALAGTGASGPFVPPIKLGAGNAQQSVTGSVFTPLLDAGSAQTYDLPFTINGTVNATGAVPEPATWAMMMLGFGGMGYAMRRKNKVGARIKLA